MGGDESGARMRVVVVPLPAQGHLNQLLHFSRVIAQRGATVSFVSTSAHVQQARRRVEGWDLHNFDIRFHELPMPNLSPEEQDTQSAHMFPLHLIPLFEAMEDQLGPHVEQLLCTIRTENNNRVVLVHDSAMGWVQTVAAKYSIPAYVFNPVGAYFKLWMKRVSDEPRGLSPVNISLKRCFPDRARKYSERQSSLLGAAKGYIINTFSALESEFIHLGEQSVYGGKPVWSVGPLLPQAFFSEERRLRVQADTECVRWLDTQAPGSVLYVSFGSLSTLSAAQIRELADGLERSGQPFLWVLRFSDGAYSSTEAQFDSACKFLQEGYERRLLQGRGFIARNWAPQLDILFHESTGGFLTHCGWNSTLESISAGVGMLTWPLHCDQFANSALITREMKAGVEVKEWENAEENELVSAEEIEKAVKRLMTSEEGMEVRKRAHELRGEARKAVSEGGSSWKDLDLLIHRFSGLMEVSQPLQ